VRHDLWDVVLEDQVWALRIAAEHVADLDTSRVAIRGWSFGGYLSALAVLRRPDVFHAAVAGAPVTDFRLYDTAYTERYLGLPDEQPDVYARGSLLGDAPRLRRPLMLIHGFADDNVLVANTLQLSRELMAAGRPHTVLPLAGVTHMTPQEQVAENLLLLQVEFLHSALASPSPG
jgi:dipeptidyl-peptidase-4